jgi:hypothetical protein
MNAAQFGNFVAGFQAEAWDLTYLGPFLNLAVPLTEAAGIAYHASGNTSAKNAPWIRREGRISRLANLPQSGFPIRFSTRVQLGEYNERCSLAQIHSNLAVGKCRNVPERRDIFREVTRGPIMIEGAAL